MMAAKSFCEPAEIVEAAKDRGLRHGRLVGLRPAKHLKRKLQALPSEVKVQAIASTSLIKVSPDIACEEAMKIMHDRKVYHLIVEDESGKFMGMVSMRDCVNLKAEDEKERAEFYQHYAFPSY